MVKEYLRSVGGDPDTDLNVFICGRRAPVVNPSDDPDEVARQVRGAYEAYRRGSFDILPEEEDG